MLNHLNWLASKEASTITDFSNSTNKIIIINNKENICDGAKPPADLQAVEETIEMLKF
jgi:hypothetical protein